MFAFSVASTSLAFLENLPSVLFLCRMSQSAWRKHKPSTNHFHLRSICKFYEKKKTGNWLAAHHQRWCYFLINLNKICRLWSCDKGIHSISSKKLLLMSSSSSPVMPFTWIKRTKGRIGTFHKFWSRVGLLAYCATNSAVAIIVKINFPTHILFPIPNCWILNVLSILRVSFIGKIKSFAVRRP